MRVGRTAFALISVLAYPMRALAQTEASPGDAVVPPSAPVATTHVVVPYAGGPIPPGAQLTHHASHALVGAGLAAFVFGYVVSVLVAENTIECSVNSSTGCISQVPATEPTTSGTTVAPSIWLLVPLVGPWAALSDPYTRDRLGSEAIAVGLLQVVGLAAVVIALISPDPYVESDQPTTTARRRNSLQWSLVPASAGGMGASVVGRF